MSVTNLSLPGKSLHQRFVVMNVTYPTDTGMSIKMDPNLSWGVPLPPDGPPPPTWSPCPLVFTNIILQVT